MKSFFIFFVFAGLLACKDPGKKTTNKTSEERTNSKAQILNNIIVHETGGLEIARAFLSYENGDLVSAKNIINVGTPAYLNLVIKKGWIAENAKVSIGIMEKIETDAGETISEAPDLFKDAPPMNEADASNLQLKAFVARTTPDIRYFIVRYRVWDKKGNGEVSGSYRLYVQ